jgi:hypothetical protein
MPAGVYRVDDAVHPGVLESPFLRLPEAPGGFPDTHDAHARPLHQRDVVELLVRHVFLIVGGAVEDALEGRELLPDFVS